tara:strand:- start:1218 stop:2708 length:1491 start_codon:yes stop_codon:yes gene_type:complete
MSLRFTNTLTKKKEIFIPLLPNKVSIYCCGVTVYDLCHLGHARSYICWDVLRRYLIWKSFDVKFVQNFTDIDDKIINKANLENLSMDDVSEKNIDFFYEDMDSLGIMRPDRMPRATQCIDHIISLIETLVDRKIAYPVDGDVYFSVEKFNEYGKLSKRDISQQQTNATGRVKDPEGSRKHSAFDFALWKGAKPGEPSYSSPWGDGRPGWHIECSAMVHKELGETIDIHLGGADLIFPHHENEIAQSEAFNNKDLANYWLHNGMVNVDGSKMSKSLGNFTTIRSLIENGISPMTLRLFVLQAHYRKPIDFTKESLEAASKGWKGLNNALSLGIFFSKQLSWPNESFDFHDFQSLKLTLSNELLEFVKRFNEYMDDDLNTSAALAVVFEIAKPLRSIFNKLNIKDEESKDKFPPCDIDLYQRWKILHSLCKSLGLNAEKFDQTKSFYDQELIINAIKERTEAKLCGDYSKADQIRNELKKNGITLYDKPGGCTDWKRD